MRRRSNTVGSQPTSLLPAGKENLIPRAPPRPSKPSAPTSLRSSPVPEPLPKRPLSNRGHMSNIQSNNSTLRKNLVFNANHDPLRDFVRQVDSDSESSASDYENEHRHHNHMQFSRLSSLSSHDHGAGLARTMSLGSASLTRRSNAVSRHVSDASGSACVGSGFAATRQLGGAVYSRSHSLADPDSCATSISDLSATTMSRRSSIHSTEGRLSIVRQMQAAELQAKEELIEQRKALYSTEQVHLRRWVTVVMLARSAALLIQNGNLRVSAHHMLHWAKTVLERRFVPMWRLRRHLRRQRAERRIAQFILKCALRRRRVHRTTATNMVRWFLNNKLKVLFSHYSKYLVKCALLIQRQWRRTMRQRDAAAQLHVLLARRTLPSFCSQLDRLCDRSKGETAKKLGTIPERLLVFALRPKLCEQRKLWFQEMAHKRDNALDQFQKSHRQSMAMLVLMPDACRRTVRVLAPQLRRFLSKEDVHQTLRECFTTLAALRDDNSLLQGLSLSKAPAQDRTPLPPLTIHYSFEDLYKQQQRKQKRRKE